MESIKYKLVYKNYSSNKSDILGKVFVKNNKNKGKLIINNKKYNLSEFITTEDIKSDKIKIVLIVSKDLCKMDYMFYNCNSLLNLSIIDDKENYDDDEPEELLYQFDDFFEYDINYNNKDDHPIYQNNKKNDLENNYPTITSKESFGSLDKSALFF